MDRVSWMEYFDFLLECGVEVWLGVFVAVIVFIIEIILCKKNIIFSSVEKKINKAKAEGKTMVATLVNCRYNDRDPENKTANRMYVALYEYYVNDKPQKKQIISTSVKPPRTITLYYISSPNKVFSEYDSGKNPLKFIIYVIPIVLAYFTMKTLGFNG